jgi:hypothetical protein
MQNIHPQMAQIMQIFFLRNLYNLREWRVHCRHWCASMVCGCLDIVEIEIPANDLFLNDRLRRKQIAGNLTLLVQSTNQQALPLTVQIATQGILGQDSVKKVSDLLFNSGGDIASFASELAEQKMRQYENDKNGTQEVKNLILQINLVEKLAVTA